MQWHTGFILTVKSEDSGDFHQIQLFGIGSCGPFILTFQQERPFLFCEKGAAIPSFPFDVVQEKTTYKNFKEKEIEKLSVKTQKQLYTLRESLQLAGIKSFEADIRPYERFLMERFIHLSIRFQGDSSFNEKTRCQEFISPELQASPPWRPNFTITSLDIETGQQNELYSIALHTITGKGEELCEVMMVGPAPSEAKELDFSLRFFDHERELLKTFLKRFVEIDPDLLIGWHVVGFDLHFLSEKCHQHQIPFLLGRSSSPVILQERSSGVGYNLFLDGRVVIDGPPTFRSLGFKFQNFKLETVAQEILGRGKDINSSNYDKVLEIEHRFRHDKVALAQYNLLDCILVTDLYKKLDIVGLVMEKAIVSGLLMDQVTFATKAFDHFYLPRLHQKGFVAPNATDLDRSFSPEKTVLLPKSAGLHRYAVSFKFKNLYPSLIKTFRIDPLSLARATGEMTNPSGISFSRQEHILPDYFEKLMRRLEAVQRLGEKSLGKSIEALMNSFYGVMCSSSCRFYHADLPEALSRLSGWVLKETVQFFTKLGYQILETNDDALLIELKSSDWTEGDRVVFDLCQKVNHYFYRLIQEKFQLNSSLELHHENSYQKIFLPLGSEHSFVAQKRGEEKLSFVGFDFEGSDWTPLALHFLQELFERYFEGMTLEESVRSYIERVKNHEFDAGDFFVYTRRMTKKIVEYSKATSLPNHIKAASLLSEEDRSKLREIDYVMTFQGPIPLQLTPKNIDYQHYIDKQIRPVAETVLGAIQKSFDDITVGQQLSLFG